MNFILWTVGGTPMPYPTEGASWERVRAAARVDGAHPHEGREPGSGGDAGLSFGGRRWRAAAAAEQPLPGTRVVLRAEELMSAPAHSLPAGSTVGEARRLQAERRLRHLPVLNEDGRLVGILSDRDLLRLGPSAPADRLVETVMSVDVLTATPEARLIDCARVMLRARVGCLPVVREDGVLVGILTRSDLLRALMSEGPLQLRI